MLNNGKKETAMSNITPINKTPKIEYMNPVMLREFHEILLNLKNEVTQAPSIETPEYQNMPDPLDIASMQEAATLEMRRRERDTLFLANIHRSLTKIENNDYGYCNECGVEIGANRLRARPTADLCVSCKEHAEIKEHQFTKRRAA